MAFVEYFFHCFSCNFNPTDVPILTFAVIIVDAQYLLYIVVIYVAINFTWLVKKIPLFLSLTLVFTQSQLGLERRKQKQKQKFDNKNTYWYEKEKTGAHWIICSVAVFSGRVCGGRRRFKLYRCIDSMFNPKRYFAVKNDCIDLVFMAIIRVWNTQKQC